jgi:leucyl/phenylalanyl-tRNA---protein transferase
MRSPTFNAEAVLAGYAHGIFPMADSRDGDIDWYSPAVRAIIPLDTFRIPRNTRKLVDSGEFEIRLDTDFRSVIAGCGEREETWISEEIEEAYVELHCRGFAHSVESWQDGKLAGGLYGVAFAGAFFGESMFHRKSGASDVALVHLVEHLTACRFTLLDIQFINPHLERYGAVTIPRSEFQAMLGVALFSGASWRPAENPRGVDP